MAQTKDLDTIDWVVGQVETLVADVERVERERDELRARIAQRSALEHERDALREKLEQVMEEHADLQRELAELNGMFDRLTRSLNQRRALTEGSERAEVVPAEVFYESPRPRSRAALPSGEPAAENGDGARAAAEEEPAQVGLLSLPASAVPDEPSEPNGGIVAAVLAAAVASAALGLLVIAVELSASVDAALVFWGPAGSLSGKTTVAALIWAVAWPALHFSLVGKQVPMRTVNRLTFSLLGFGLLGTFPPFFTLFTLH